MLNERLREMDDVPPLSERISFRIHQLSAQMARITNPLFREFGIDVVSSQILLLVQERGSVGISELLGIVHLPQSTISHQLQRLEKRGYITRERGGRDQRAVSISLTESGAEVADECEAISTRVYGAMVDGLPGGSASEVCAELDTMLDQLSRLKATEG